MARTLVASDDFNRASLGANWDQTNAFNGSVNIVSSTLVSAAHSQECAARYVSGTFAADQYSSLELVTWNQFGNNRIGVAARMSPDDDGNRDHYEYVIFDNNGSTTKTTELAKVVNGSRTILTSSSVLWASGDRIEIECEGTTIRGLKNGTEVVSVTDSDITTGRPGVRTTSGKTGDNWQGGDLSASTPDPALTDVDTDETLTVGQTGIAVTGTDMGAANANRTFSIVQGAVEVDQTETGTGTATAATLSLVFETAGADLKHGAATLRITRDDLATGDIAVTIDPETGLLYVDLTSVNTTADNRITAAPDLEIGDQLHARGVGGGAAPAGLTLNADATFEFSSGNTPTDFDVRVWDVNDATWGAWATQSVGDLVPADIAQEQSLDAPTLTQTHLISPGNLTQAQVFDAPTLSQDHQVAPGNIDQTQTLDQPAVSQDHQIPAVDVAQDQAVDAPTLSVEHLLSPDELDQEQALQAPAVTQDHQVTPADLAQAQLTDAPTLEQVHTLAVADMAQLQVLEAASLIITGTLTPDDIAQIQTLGAALVTQDHQLTVADLVQLQSIEAPSLEQTHLVTVTGLAQDQALDRPTIIITGQLVPLSITQLQALEAGDIVQTHDIAVDDLVQLQVLDSPTTAKPGYLIVTSIRLLPALNADIRLIPALSAKISLKPQ